MARRKVHKDWQHLQERTFTKWFNNVLRGHLTSSDSQVEDLQTDLKDGLKLVRLLESLSKEKISGIHKKPNFEPHKIENLSACFRFMEKANIKLVNIGNMDIYNGNMKLILGLIWTLIRRFQIRSMGTALSTKEALLTWVNTQLPNQNVKNFTTDWNDGVALCALIDRIKPGLCPQYETLKSGDRLENCKQGMMLAEEELGISRLLEAEDLCHPRVDELSVMTYVSSFCTPANNNLLMWIQSVIPERNITNFNKDWNDGINLSCLLNVLVPGTLPDCHQLDPHQSLDNLTQAMKIGEEYLGVKPVLTPAQLADPKVDELNVATYLSRFQFAKPIPLPHMIACKGHGLFKAISGRSTTFEADCSKGGAGDLAVTVTDSEQRPVEAQLIQKDCDLIEVKYVPQVAGKLTIEVKWSESPVPGSPFHPDVIDLGKFSFTGKQITGGECTQIGSLVVMEAKGITEVEVSDLDVLIQHSDGHTETAKILLKENGVIECTYTPTRPSKDQVYVKIAGIDIPGSPFEVKVVDPSQCSVQMVDPSAGQPLIANKPATFTIMASEANLGGITAEVTRPDSSKPDEVNVIPQGDGSNVATFTPVEIGEYKVSFTCAGKDIRGSPLFLNASDPGKCEFLDAIPSMVQIGKPSTIRLNVKGAGVGTVDVSSSQLSVLTVITSSDSTEPEIYTIQFTPVSVGEASIDVKWEGNSVSPTPCPIQVCDATKCSAYGTGITEGRGKCTIPFEFTVLTKEAGKGELIVKPKGQKTTYAAKVTESSEGMYDVNFTTYEFGVHTIDVLWGDAHIPDSPFKVDFVKVGDANQFTASGDGLKEATAQKAAKCLLVGPTSGLLENNVLQVQVSNEQVKSTMVNKDKFDPKCNDAVVHVSDHGNASYSVEYAVPVAGIYSLSITSDGSHIPGSPFEVKVLAASDASKCRAFGEVIELAKKACVFKVNRSMQFGVDITDAGEGKLSITGKNPKGGQISPIFTNDQEQDGKREKHVHYNPEDIGHHILEIKWEGVDIPDSPLDLNVVDPSKCKISDLPPQNGMVEMKPMQFTVTCEGAGDSSPEVSVGAFGSSEMTTLQPSSQTGAVFCYTCTPESLGNTSLSIKFGGFEIPNSPFTFIVIDPNRYSISGLNLEGKYALVSYPIAFDISSKKFNNDDIIDVTQHGPRGEKEHTSLTPKDGKCSHSFTPMTPGAYDIFVECSGVQVSGSPLQVHVVDPQNCKIFGKFPDQFQVGVKEDIVVNTQAAGEGELQVFFNGAKEHPSIDCVVQKQDISSYVMKFNGKQVDSTSVSILWGGFNIKGSPFHVNISDANKCNAIGSVITSKTATTGEAVSFSVETKDAGKGKLTVTPKGPSATYKADIKAAEGKYDVTFTPWEVGQVSLDLVWGKTAIPNSPFIINVENSKNICNATGDGLKTAMVGREASFTVITTEMGLLKKKAMAVSVSGIRVGRLKTNIKDNQNGTYTVSYTPQKPGAYVANVEVNKSHILGSPFKINVVSAPDASKCIVGGFASQPNSVHVRGSHPEITVDTSEAGTGKLEAVIEGPNKYRPKVYTSEGVNGLYSIKFQATNPGRYIITLLWSGQEIPGSPFKVRVHPAPDASKVKAYGSGLEDGYIGTPGEFVVDTRNAGIGTITINVHGIKESFKIAAKRSDSDPRIITGRYDPKKKGDYVIRMLWDGVHIPRSPFFVKIRGKPGSHGSDEEVTQPKRMAPDIDKPLKATPQAKPLPVRTKDQESKVLESAFAKAAPVYDAPQTKKGKKDKSTPKKFKDSKKKKKAQESKTPPPITTVGPVAPNLKMKSNVAMAMALPTPQLLPVPDGKEQPSRVQTSAVGKKTDKTKKTTTPDKGKKAATAKAKPMSPKQRPTSPKGQPTSPAKKPYSPEEQPTPTKKSPSKGGPPKSTSPAKPTKPVEQTGTIPAKPPTDPSKPTKHTKRKELTDGSATKVSEATSKSSAASKPPAVAKPAGVRATKPTGSAKPSGEHKASERPTSPKVKQPQPPQHHRSERPTYPVKSKPGVERGSKPRADDGRPRGGAMPTQSPYQPIERSASPRSVAKATESAELKRSTQTKSPSKVASSRGPHVSTKLPSGDAAYYAPKPKSPRRREMSPESYDGRHFQPPQRAMVRGQPSAGAGHHHRRPHPSREAGMRGEAVDSAYGEGRRPHRRAIQQPSIVDADGRGGRPTSPQRYMYVRVPIDDTKPPPKRRTHNK